MHLEDRIPDHARDVLILEAGMASDVLLLDLGDFKMQLLRLGRPFVFRGIFRHDSRNATLCHFVKIKFSTLSLFYLVRLCRTLYGGTDDHAKVSKDSESIHPRPSPLDPCRAVSGDRGVALNRYGLDPLPMGARGLCRRRRLRGGSSAVVFGDPIGENAEKSEGLIPEESRIGTGDATD